MTPARRDRWVFAAVFVFALALRLVAVFQYEARHPNARHPVIDEASYDEWAREIAGGEWLGDEVYFQEPLYPYALGALYAALGPERLAARIVQCALWAATAVLTGILARRLFGRAAGFLAALAIAVYGPGLVFPALLLKENLLLPLLTLFAIVLLRTRDSEDDPASAGRDRRRWLGAGLLAGLCALLRGNMLVLLPLFAIWPIARAWIRARALGPGAVNGAAFLLGSACALLPVALRNLTVGGVFLLTTSGAGTNLYGGNHLGNPYGRAGEAEFVRGIPEHEAGDWRREAERRAGSELDPGEVSAYWRDEALRSFRAHPREHAVILWNKLRLTLGRYEVPDVHSLDWDVRYVPIARAMPGFGLVGSLGLAGMLLFVLHVRWGRRGSYLVSSLPPAFTAADPGAAAGIVVLFLAYLATIVLTVTSDRARLPLVPLLAPFAAWTVVWTGRALASRSQDAIVRLALALFLAALAVYARVLPQAEIAEDHDEREHNLAVQYLREGEHEQAGAIAARLVRDHPSSARSRILLAEVDFRAGRLDEALARVEALATEPSLNARERFRAASLAGWIQLERGDAADAEAMLRRALEFDGESRDLREGLARALLASEGRAKAEEALAVLDRLRAEIAPGEEVSGVELLLAQAEFTRGRAILEGPEAETERKLGQESVQVALDRLRPLVESDATPVEIRRRARIVAGGIQIWRRNWSAAENHFRAALALGPDARAELGLVQALIGSIEADEAGEHRAAKIEEAARRLEDLKKSDIDAGALSDAQTRLEKAR